MRGEIVSAADFLVSLLRSQTNVHKGQVSESQLQLFKKSLTDTLNLRYQDHWFPDKPNRGSGYRCIRINGKMDPVIAQAGNKVGLAPTFLYKLFPREFTMWIDPEEVSYRIGENGSICHLAFDQSSSSEASSSTDEADQELDCDQDFEPEQQLQHHRHHNQREERNNFYPHPHFTSRKKSSSHHQFVLNSSTDSLGNDSVVSPINHQEEHLHRLEYPTRNTWINESLNFDEWNCMFMNILDRKAPIAGYVRS